MFKVTHEHELAHKHLQLALVDASPCSTPKNNSKLFFVRLFRYHYRTFPLFCHLTCKIRRFFDIVKIDWGFSKYSWQVVYAKLPFHQTCRTILKKERNKTHSKIKRLAIETRFLFAKSEPRTTYLALTNNNLGHRLKVCTICKFLFRLGDKSDVGNILQTNVYL